MILWWLWGCEPAKTRTVVVVHTEDGEEIEEIEEPEQEEEEEEPRPEPPVIEELEIVETPDQLEVTVLTEPGTAPLQGGTVAVTLDGAEPLLLGIPEDLLSAEDGALTFALDRPKVGQCTLGARHALGVEIVDGAGRSSDRVELEHEALAVGTVVEELGSDLASVVGVLTAETTICGTLSSTGNDGQDYTGDRDVVAFRIEPTGEWDLRLDWQVTGDWDLYLYEEAASGDYQEIDAATGPDLQGPESLTAALSRNASYALEVAGWSGDSGDWTVVIR